MEQKKFTHLDEFFARAKASEEPVITKEDVRAVLEEQDPMQSQTQHNTRIYKRKGFIMSTVGFIAASAVLVGYLSFQGEKQLAGSGQLSVAGGQKEVAHTLSVRPDNDATPQGEPKVTKKVIIINDDGNTTSEIQEPPELPAAPVPPLPPDGNLTSPVKVMGVAIYRASEDELKKLAIEEKKGTGLGFVVKLGKDNFEKYYIPEQGWGVIMKSEKVEKPEKYFEPVVVTDAQGNKRMINLSDDSSVMQYRKYKGKHSTTMIVDGAGPDVDIAGGSVDIDNEESNMVVSINDDTSKHQRTRVIRNTIKIDTPDSNNVDIHALVEEAMKKAKESLRYSKHALDSAKEITVQLKIDGTDTLLDNVSKERIHELRFTIDSLMRPEQMKEMAKEGKVKGTIIVRDRHPSDKKMAATQFVIDTTSGVPSFPGMYGVDREIRKMESRVSRKLNSLVPVLVRVATETTHNDKENRDYDNGVIMWFEPTKEFKEAMPMQTYEVTINGDLRVDGPNSVKVMHGQQVVQSVKALDKVTLYPNPATTRTTVHFVTGESRSVAFSVHDISGKKLLDGGSIAERPAGEYDFELNLQSLSPGLYLIVITTDHGEQSIQRVVVEK